ncbi:CLUMA_CG021386, isoform A [Clunio marinus]|uniref:Large ribosomal subunit protein mL42 n=1 Tax=Clunio marinus TaxID=568069 RepID=A0A1J1J7V2_9DIPT|nr:CLUMA_CG021386, isoform A [Clunio marinus]
MFTTKRFFSQTCRYLARFKVYGPENPNRNRAYVESLAESQDGTAFFAWHPKKEVPYEFTRPLPTKIEQKSQSLLKEQQIEKAKLAWKHSHPDFAREELARLTFTTKHRWYPRARDKKHNFKKTLMDRKYL